MSARSCNPANPRQAACNVLNRIRKEGGYADQLMDRELAAGQLSGPDRGLFAELVFGVLRRQGTLDHILGQLLDQPLAKLEPLVLILLRVGLYQLACLDRIPESAAVNETVKLAKQSIPRASGLVNAVLRSYLRRREQITFPDPLTEPATAIAARHSHPIWLVRQWLDQIGAEETALLAEASSCPPPLTLRVNTLITSRADFLQLLAEHDINAAPCRFSPDGVTIEGRQQITGLPGFQDGLFTVQDEASQMAALLMGVRPGELVLDCCAAPGGKVTHLAQLMENRGEIMATDISTRKLPLIRETASRLGINIITTATANLLQPQTLPQARFDRILLDAPCSGLGIIRRNPEAKWRLTPDDLTRLAASQKKMLENAFTLLKPGGVLLYSTCSTTLEENEDVVHDFISGRNDCMLENLHDIFPQWRELFTSAGMYRAWPHRHAMDGFCAARLRKCDLIKDI